VSVSSVPDYQHLTTPAASSFFTMATHEEEIEYESLPVGAGWGVNMLAGAMVSPCRLFQWSVWMFQDDKNEMVVTWELPIFVGVHAHGTRIGRRSLISPKLASTPC
jgi:hypothetical protein